MDKPKPPLTETTPFGCGISGDPLFAVQQGIPIEAALTQACELLNGAVAAAYESADNATPPFRPLALSVVHPIEAARALVESSLAAVARPASP